MDENRKFWPAWAQFLQRWGLNGPAAALLEAAGPLSAVLAQLVYFGQPFAPGQQSRALAEMLENPQAGRDFAAFLREEETR